MIRISNRETGKTWSLKFFVFYLQFIISLDGLGVFYSSAFLIRRLYRAATLPALQERTFYGQSSFLSSLGSDLDEFYTSKTQMLRGNHSHELNQLITEDLCLLIKTIEINKETLWIDRVKTKFFRSFHFRWETFCSVSFEGWLVRSRVTVSVI